MSSTPSDDETMLSRSGRTDAGGKLDERLDIPIAQDLNDGIVTLATLAGMPRAEYARRVLAAHVFGELGMAQRIARVGWPRPSDESPKG